MRIKRFAVSGFKNFTQEVVLDDMGDICVIHGENNVGKSNLLEAMLLFFKMLQYDKVYEMMGKSKQRIDADLRELGFESRNIFNLTQRLPIKLRATLLITPKIINDYDGTLCLLPNFQHDENQEYEVAIQIKLADTVELQIENPMENWFAEPKKQQAMSSETLNAIMLKTVADRFILIATHRRIFSDDEITQSDDYTTNNYDDDKSDQKSTDGIVPQPLRLQLYNASVSFDLAILKRWKLFVKIMSREDILKDILGEGQFIARYDPSKKAADLVFDMDDKRIPINLLGSGIQQVVALIARLLVSNATFVAIEEPELNLRYTLQQRLYEVFKEIVADPAGPSQIFLTSHSPAFEHGEHFYQMRATEHGVVVEKRPISQARIATGMNCDDSLAGKSAPYSYVTSEGLVRLPEHVLQDLAIPHGGGVYFLKRKDTEHVELLTDEQYFDLFESADEETSEHE